jgi:hypothetical protein
MTDDDWVDSQMPAPRIVQKLCPCPEWLPINSAPKNGDRILLRCANGEAGDRWAEKCVTIGQWNKHEVFGVPSPADWYSDSGYWLEPDAWMPLPTP